MSLMMSSIHPATIPTVSITDIDKESQSSTSSRPPLSSRQRSSSLLHKNIISRMRPLPFQYVYTLWHTKANNNLNNSYTLNELSNSIPDIASFYRIFNNFPWDSVALRDSVHFFRSGIKPQWEDRANLKGGCWTIKVKREDSKALQAWEELCLMVCGGELQASVAQEDDHILGISYSPRQNWSHISIWTRDGSNKSSIETLQSTVITRLSADLRPSSEAEYYYKKHSEHDGWKEIIAGAEIEG